MKIMIDVTLLFITFLLGAQYGRTAKVLFVSLKATSRDTSTCGGELNPCGTINYALRNQQSDIVLKLDGGTSKDDRFVYKLNESIRLNYNLSVQKSSTTVPTITVFPDHFRPNASIFHIFSTRVTFDSIFLHTIPFLYTVHSSNLNITFRNCHVKGFISLQKTGTSELLLHIFYSRFENFDIILKWTTSKDCNVSFHSSEFIGERNESKKYLVFSNVSTLLKQQGIATKSIYDRIQKMTIVSCLFLHLVNVFESISVDETYILHSNFSSNQIKSINGTKYLVKNQIFVGTSAYISNTSFIDNFYTSGAIDFIGIGKTQIISSTFENNTAISGGALSLNDLSVIIIDCKFIRNKAHFGGGAIKGYLTDVLIDSSYFNDNAVVNLVGINSIYDLQKGAVKAGGAIMFEDVTFTINNSVFVKNTAPSRGGTIYYEGRNFGTLSILTNCIITGTNKKTSLMGSLIYLSGSPLLLTNVTLNVLTRYRFQSAVFVSIGAIGAGMTELKFAKMNCPTSYNIGSEFQESKSYYFFCTACDKGTYNLEGGFENYFDKNNITRNQIKCHLCPTGGICDQGIISKDNYWGYENSKREVKFTSCPQLYCCSAYGQECVTHQTCEKNRKGRICGECVDGFSESIITTRCIKNKQCGTNWFWISVSICALIYTVLILYFGELTRLGKHVFKSILNQFSHTSTRCMGDQGKDIRTEDTKISSGLLKIFIFFYQIEFLLQVKSSLKKHFKISSLWTDLVSSIFNFKPSTQEASSYQLCAWENMNAVEKEVVKVAAIFSVFLMFILMFVIHQSYQRFIIWKKRWSVHEFQEYDQQELLLANVDPVSIQVGSSTFGLRVKCAFLRLILMTYIPLTSVTLKLINCIPIGDSKYLFIYGKVKCFHNWWQYLSMCILVLWVIPFCLSLYLSTDLLKSSKIKPAQFLKTFIFPPLSFYYYYSTYTRQYGDPRIYSLSYSANIERGRLLEVFSASYRPEMSKWVGMVIFRKFVLTLVSIFTINPVLRLYILLLLLVLFLNIQIRVQPYKSDTLNWLESISLSLLTVFAAMNLYWANSFILDINTNALLLHNLGEVFLYTELVMLSLPMLALALLLVTAFGLFIWRNILKLCCKRNEPT